MIKMKTSPKEPRMVVLAHIMERTLEQMVRVVDEMLDLQESLRNALFEREWFGVEEKVTALLEKSQALQMLEEDRTRVYAELLAELELPPDTPLRTALRYIDPPVAQGIADVAGRLRERLFRVRGLGEVIARYAEASYATVYACLRDLFPDRFLGGYGKDGRRSQSESSLLIDTRL